MKLIPFILPLVAAFSSAHAADISLPQNVSLAISPTDPAVSGIEQNYDILPKQLHYTDNIQSYHPIAKHLRRGGEPGSWLESDLSDVKTAERGRESRAGHEAWLESPSGPLLKRGVPPERVAPNARSRPDFEGILPSRPETAFRVPSRPETAFRVPPIPEVPFRKPSTPELQQKVSDLISKFSANKGGASGANLPAAPERPAPQAGGAESPSERQQSVADLINKFSGEGNGRINSPSTPQPPVGQAPKASTPQVGETVADLINQWNRAQTGQISPDYEGVISPKPNSLSDIRPAPAPPHQPEVPSRPADLPTSLELGDSVGQPKGINNAMPNKNQLGRPDLDTKTPDVGSSTPEIERQKPPSDPVANKLQDFGDKSHSLDEMKRINDAKRKADQESRILEANKNADAAEAASNSGDSPGPQQEQTQPARPVTPETGRNTDQFEQSKFPPQPQRDPGTPENEASSWANRLAQLRDVSYETQSVSDEAPSPDLGGPSSNPSIASRPEEWSKEGFTSKVEGVLENLTPPPPPESFSGVDSISHTPSKLPDSLSPEPQVPKPQIPPKLRPEQMNFKDKLNLWKSMCDDSSGQSLAAMGTWSNIRKFSPNLVGACEDGLEEMMSETAETPGIPNDPLPKGNLTPESSTPGLEVSNPQTSEIKPGTPPPNVGKEPNESNEPSQPKRQNQPKEPKTPKTPKKKPVSKEDAKLLETLRNELSKSRKEREDLSTKPDENSLPNGVTTDSGPKSLPKDGEQTVPDANPFAALTLKDGYFDTGTKMSPEVRKWKAKANKKPSKKEIKKAQKQAETENPGVEFPKGDVIRAAQLLALLKKDAADPSKTAATAEFVSKELKAAGFAVPQETITQMRLLGHEITPEMETKGIISGLAALPYLAPVSNFLAAPEILEVGLLAGDPAVLGAVGVAAAAPEIAGLAMHAAPVLLTTAGTVGEMSVETLASVGLGGAQFVGMVGKEAFKATTEVASARGKAGAAAVKVLSTGWMASTSVLGRMFKFVARVAPIWTLVHTLKKPKVVGVLVHTTTKTRIADKSITEFITETIYGGQTVVVTTTPHKASKTRANPKESIATKTTKAHKKAGHKTRSSESTATKTSNTHKTKVAPTTSAEPERIKSLSTKQATSTAPTTSKTHRRTKAHPTTLIASKIPTKSKGSRPIPIPVPVPVSTPHHGKHPKIHPNATTNTTLARHNASVSGIWWNETRIPKPVHLNVSNALANWTAVPKGTIFRQGIRWNETRSSKPVHLNVSLPIRNWTSTPRANISIPEIRWNGTRSSRPANIRGPLMFNVSHPAGNWTALRVPWNISSPAILNLSNSVGNWSTPHLPSPVNISNLAFGDHHSRPVAVNISAPAGNWTSTSRVPPMLRPVPPQTPHPSPVNVSTGIGNQTTLTTILLLPTSSPTPPILQPIYPNTTSASPAPPTRRLRTPQRQGKDIYD